MATEEHDLGISCRGCGCKHLPVTHTWKTELQWKGRKRIVIRRRRICRYCGLPKTTVEWEEDETNKGYPMLPPKESGTIENNSEPKNPFL